MLDVFCERAQGASENVVFGPLRPSSISLAPSLLRLTHTFIPVARAYPTRTQQNFAWPPHLRTTSPQVEPEVVEAEPNAGRGRRSSMQLPTHRRFSLTAGCRTSRGSTAAADDGPDADHASKQMTDEMAAAVAAVEARASRSG